MSDVPQVFDRWSLVDEAAGLSAPLRCILGRIARLTSRNGTAWPSVASLASAAGVKTERAAQRLLAEAIKLGILERIVTGGGVNRDGTGRTSSYRVVWDRLRAMNPDRADGVPETNGQPTTPTVRTGFATDNPDAAAREPRRSGARTPTLRRTNPDAQTGGEQASKNNSENNSENNGALTADAVVHACPEPPTVASALVRAGVRQGKILAALTGCEALTVEAIEQEARSILERKHKGEAIPNPPGLLIQVLADRFGIELPSGHKATGAIAPDVLKANKTLLKLRRERGIGQ